MKLTRRVFIKQTAAASAASVAGIVLPVAQALGTSAPDVATPGTSGDLRWSKAPCRFCGTGCGVSVGVKDGKVVATQGDPQAEVNRGLNCVKGYFVGLAEVRKAPPGLAMQLVGG